MYGINKKRINSVEEEKNVLAQVREDGLSLRNLSYNWQNNKKVVLEAVRQNGLAIRFAPKKFQENLVIGLTAVNNTGLARLWLTQELQENVLIRKIAENTFPKRFPEPFINQERLELEANKKVCNRLIFKSPKGEIPFTNISNGISRAQNAGCDIQVDYVSEDPYASDFIRDSGVSAKGRILIPFDLQPNERMDKKLFAILPNATAQEELDILYESCGEGFAKINTDQMIKTAVEKDIPYELAATCIEGGNCILYRKDGETYALMGEWSVYLSLLVLKKQNYFAKMDEEEMDIPSSIAFRMARNLQLCKEFKEVQDSFEKENSYFYKKEREKINDEFNLIEQKIQKNSSLQQEEKETFLRQALKQRQIALSNISEKSKTACHYVYFEGRWGEYKKKLDAPLSSEDQQKFLNKARQIESRIKKTLAKISEELGIPLEKITFLPQLTFHIDMELFVAPSGEVVMNNYGLVEHFLDEYFQISQNIDAKTRKRLEQCKEVARLRFRIYQDLYKNWTNILASKKIPFRQMPAIFPFPKHSELNYCNGVFLGNKLFEPNKEEEFIFVTTGPTFNYEQTIHEKFSQLFKTNFPHIRMLPIEKMSGEIEERNGGIRCLTMELFS